MNESKEVRVATRESATEITAEEISDVSGGREVTLRATENHKLISNGEAGDWHPD